MSLDQSLQDLPRIETRRLILRPLQAGDADAMATLGGRDFNVARWLTSFEWPYQDGTAETFLASLKAKDPVGQEAVFAITLGGVFAGVMAVQAPGDLDQAPDCPSIGYWLGRSFQGFGYAAEAAEAVLGWTFAAYGCEAIAARAYEDNAASRKVLRRLGFKPIGKTTRFSKPLDQKVEHVVVRLDLADFEDRRAAA